MRESDGASDDGFGGRTLQRDASRGTADDSLSDGVGEMQRERSSISAAGSIPGSPGHKVPGVKMGDFVKVEATPKDPAMEKGSKWERTLRHWNGFWIPNSVAAVIVFDLIVTCVDIDERAAGRAISPMLSTVMDCCVLVYTLEFALNVKLRKLAFLKDWMTWLDLLIISCGWLEIVVHFTDQPEIYLIRDIRMLRVVRICRLANLVRKARSLRELRKMITMLSTCTRTLAWSLLFCFGMMTMWAMLLVELVHPLCCEDPSTDSCSDCLQCQRSTGSIMDANLLLFKTVIAGDSWGRVAVPIIEASPLTAILFCGSLLTLVFGVMNLVVAVVVDTFAEVRDRDMMNLAEELELNNEDDRKQLLKMFERIEREDQEDRGVTLEELINGVRKDRELQSRLRVMDIDEVDLEQLFHMIDADGSGTVEADEFITPLSRWVHESKTATRFIKYNLMRHMQQQEAFIQDISYRLDRLCEYVLSPMCTLTRRSSESSDDATGVPIEPSYRGKSFEVVAPDDGVEQPQQSQKNEPAAHNLTSESVLPREDVVKAALDSAQQLLLASNEELLNRSLQVMKGVLHDVVLDANRGPLDAGKRSRPSIRSMMRGRTGLAGLQSAKISKDKPQGMAMGWPRLSTEATRNFGPPASELANPFFLERRVQRPLELGNIRLAQHMAAVSLPVGKHQVPTAI